ncbi:retinoic acid-induced protein 3-like [Huso huso]|uniref:Retinoic acid-induced protein 3-like n=1 Tax=Huso huso TaxID=61971 RepID=A0ABR0YGH0_HUSHU
MGYQELLSVAKGYQECCLPPPPASPPPPPLLLSQPPASIYSYLCDTQASWGIALKAVAAVVVTPALIITLLGTVPLPPTPRSWAAWPCSSTCCWALWGCSPDARLSSSRRPAHLPDQSLPLGVLCHVLLRPGRSRSPPAGAGAEGADPDRGLGGSGDRAGADPRAGGHRVEWLLTVLVRDGNPCFYSQGEFVMLLIYVMFLMALGLVLAVFTLCGTHGKWKKHGCFAAQLHFLSRKGKERVWEEPASSLPTLTYKKHGVDNQVYLPDDRGAAESPYATAMPMENLRPKPDFTIPRPQTTASVEHPYIDYYGRHINSPE